MNDAPPPPADVPNPYPATARAAGVMWVVVGTLLALWTCGAGVAGVVSDAKQPGERLPNPAEGCSVALGVMLGAAFAVAGMRIISGSAADTLLTSIGSLAVGLVFVGLGVVVLLWAKAPPPEAPAGAAGLLRYVGVVNLVKGYALMGIGGLGLAGRSGYLRRRAVAVRARWRRPPGGPGDEAAPPAPRIDS